LAGALAGIVVMGIAVMRLGSGSVEPSVAPAPVCVRAAEVGVDTTAPCAAPVVVDGTTVQVGTSRFEVGQPGDVVTLGDWDCDGGATPAVLRPSTGEVFIFSAWAGDADLQVSARARLAGAVRLLAVPDPERSGCSVLLAERADGVRLDVPPGAEA
jgi:hypothetical protein